MSNSYKNGAFALGLVVGGGLALNLFLWLDYRTNSEISTNSGTSQNAQNSQIGQYWDGLIGTFVSPSDTLAQWVMAFFTICATIVLIFTLRSANRTNSAAIKASEAALQANQIMREEQRPWATLSIKELRISYFDDSVLALDMTLVVKNDGARPLFFIVPEVFAWNPGRNADHVERGGFEKRSFEMESIFNGEEHHQTNGKALPPKAVDETSHSFIVKISDDGRHFGAFGKVFSHIRTTSVLKFLSPAWRLTSWMEGMKLMGRCLDWTRCVQAGKLLLSKTFA